MRRFLIILCSVLLSFSSYSQAPGYLGKRFVLGIGSCARISPIDYFDNDTYSNVASPELSFRYVISKYKSLGLRFHYFNTEINFDMEYRLSDSISIRTGVYDTRTLGIGIDYRFYNSDFIAPVGAYWQLSIAAFRNKVDDLFSRQDKIGFINYYGPSSYENLEKISTLYYFGLSRGKTFVLYKSLGFDLAYYAGFSVTKDIFSSIVEELTGDYNMRNTKERIEYDYQYYSYKVIKKRFSFGIRFNINLLL